MLIVPSGKVALGGSATNGTTPSSFTGAPLYISGTKLDLCLKKQLFIDMTRYAVICLVC